MRATKVAPPAKRSSVGKRGLSAVADESEPKFTWHEPKSHTGLFDFFRFANRASCPAMAMLPIVAAQRASQSS